MSRSFFLVAVSLLLVSCATQPSASDAAAPSTSLSEVAPASGNAADEAAIAEASARLWTARGDAASFGRYFTEDAILMFPGVVNTVGRSAIIDFAAERFPARRSTDLKVHQREIDVYGDTAYELSSYGETIASEGESTRMQGRYVHVWKRANDGTWRVHRALLNFSDVGPDPDPNAAPAQ